MEGYTGIKFSTRRLAPEFSFDQRLAVLNYWAVTMAELGLAPLHDRGAYGNHSHRVSPESFIITRTGMQPQVRLDVEDYCLVRYEEKEDLFCVAGRHEPSSECFLHHAIYRHVPGIAAILHGHCSLLNTHAQALAIPVTATEYPYGTKELAREALDCVTGETSFFIMKNHGFVATGRDIDEAARLVLRQYRRLLDLLLAQAAAVSPAASG